MVAVAGVNIVAVGLLANNNAIRQIKVDLLPDNNGVVIVVAVVVVGVGVKLAAEVARIADATIGDDVGEKWHYLRALYFLAIVDYYYY